MLQAQVKKISRGSCRRRLSFPTKLRNIALGLSGQSVTSYMVCAEAERDGTGTCDVRSSGVKRNIHVIFQNSSLQGDSGSPLMANNRGTWELVGLTSWGIDCEQKGLPTVYAAVKRK